MASLAALCCAEKPVDYHTHRNEAWDDRGRHGHPGTAGHRRVRLSPELAADAFRRLSQLQDVVGLGRSMTVHVDVSRADFSGTEQACARATTVAELIEPELR